MPKAPAVDKSKKKQYTKTQPVRLYQKGIFTGFRRYRIGQNLNQTIIHIPYQPYTSNDNSMQYKTVEGKR